MKKLIIATAIFIGGLATYNKADAQVSLNVGINIGSQPDWGPVGYDYAQYYYMPDIDTYYSVPTHEYIYLSGNRWIHSAYLPTRYRSYNVYNGYKVVINDRNPWERATVYRTRYAKYRGRPSQVVIRDSRDVKYKDHWKGNNGRGNAYGHYKGNDHDNGRGHDNRHGHDNGNRGRGHGRGH